MSSISDVQVYVALVVALIPGIMAFRLATELYKQSSIKKKSDRELIKGRREAIDELALKVLFSK